MSKSPTNPEPKTRRRTAPWTGLAISLVLGATLVGCSDDGGNEQTGPTTTVDVKAAELEVQCELVKSYVSFESATRGSLGSPDDPAAQGFEARRVQALERVLGTFKGDVPAEITAAADQLRALPITAAPTDQSTLQVNTSLKQLTDYFDPRCGTEGGRDPDDDGNTTLPPLPSTTVAGATPTSPTAGGPAPTDTTASTAMTATTATTATTAPTTASTS